jgi:alpha-tubulin suppressor-like RCC1 family protein
LSINNQGNGYTLIASVPGLTGGISNSFNIMATSRRWVQISSGGGYTCGVTTVGAAYCWGDNGFGQLGNGTATNSNTPTAVSGGHTFAAVSAGSGLNTCGLTTAGAAYCWGTGDHGELGNGTTSSSTTPVAVSGGLIFTVVGEGNSFACGLTTAGKAYCWGSNGGGMLGTGTTTSSPTPVAVAGGLIFTMVSVGYESACGVTAAGAPYCWGFNIGGTPVAGPGGLIFSSVGGGGVSNCGLTTAGAAYCWGRNENGELGNGTNISSTTPVAVSGAHTFETLSTAEGSGSCGVTTSGAAYCWGYNLDGELGNGTPTTTSRSETPVAVSGGLIFASVNGSGGTKCGVTTAGLAYCWGSNNFGELGNGTTFTGSLIPVVVP